MAGRRRLCFIAGLALSLAATIVRADFADDYALGLRAVDEGRFQDARRYLEKAVAAQAEPVEKVILNGSLEQPYLPYHFLGVVAYKLGDCDNAKAQWGNPINRRMIGRLNQIRQQEQRLAESCQPRKTEAAQEQKSTSAQSTVPAPVPVPESAAAQQSNPSTPPIAEKPQVEKPPVEKQAVEKPVVERTSEKPARKSDVPPRTEAPLPAPTPTPTESSADAAGTSERTPAPRLVRAVEDFIAGRYEEAARVEPDTFRAARGRFHAYLVRAASRFTLAQVDGDKQMLALARDDARAARAIDAKIAPDEILFSPKFRAFYAQSR